LDRGGQARAGTKLSQGISKADAVQTERESLQKQVEFVGERETSPLGGIFATRPYARLAARRADAYFGRGLDDANDSGGAWGGCGQAFEGCSGHIAQTMGGDGDAGARASAIASAERMMVDRILGVGSAQAMASGGRGPSRAGGRCGVAEAYLLKAAGGRRRRRSRRFRRRTTCSLEWDDKAKRLAWREGSARFMDAKGA